MTVARRVAPGREAEFEDWSAALTRAAVTFPGFLGAGMLRPGHVGEPWHVVFRFDSVANLRGWEVSPERAELLAAGEELVHSTDVHRVTGLETWFALPGRGPRPRRRAGRCSPSPWSGSTSCNWCSTGPATARACRWPCAWHWSPSRSPPLMTWLVMPRAARLLQDWLYAPPRRI